VGVPRPRHAHERHLGGDRFSRKEIIAGDRGSLSCHRLDCLDSSAETHSKNSILVLLRNHDD
jgi:hypothetical protein